MAPSQVLEYIDSNGNPLGNADAGDVQNGDDAQGEEAEGRSSERKYERHSCRVKRCHGGASWALPTAV